MCLNMIEIFKWHFLFKIFFMKFLFKSASTGSLVDGQKEKKLSGLATVDETQEYRFDSSVGINTKGPMTKYKPKVIISYPNAAPLSLDGSVDVMNNKQKQTLDSVVVLKGIQDDPITINGTLEFEILFNLLNFTKTSNFW